MYFQYMQKVVSKKIDRGWIDLIRMSGKVVQTDTINSYRISIKIDAAITTIIYYSLISNISANHNYTPRREEGVKTAFFPLFSFSFITDDVKDYNEME